jgi:type IV pilus assembly protein PilV
MSLIRQRGAGLVEALIAILILSIGLLGMLGMQTASLKFEQTSWIRSAVAINVSGLADRIRANSGALAPAYAFSDTYANERTAIENDVNHFTPTVDCNANSCTAAELAAYDLLAWRRQINDQMPGAAGFVVPTGSKGQDLRFLITVAWFDKDNAVGATLVQPDACPVPMVGNAGISSRNCCPSAVGAPADLAGVRCVNVEVIP